MKKRKMRFCFALCLFLFFLPVIIFGQQYSCTKIRIRNLKREDVKLIIEDTKVIITPWNEMWNTGGYIIELTDIEEGYWKFILNEGFPVYDVVFDAAENAYAGSDTCIYFSLDRGENWTILPAPKFHRIYEMFWAGDTVLWVADSSKVWRLRLQGYQWQIALELEGKKSFAQTPEGIYLGVRGKGLYFLPWSKSATVPEAPWEYVDMLSLFPELELANQIEDIAYNPRDSSLWVVSYGIPGKKGLAGVFYRKANQWQKLTDEGFPDISVMLERFGLVAPALSGAICFGGCDFSDGLYILKPDGSWDWLTMNSNSLLNEEISSITPDPFHNNWVWVSHPYGGATLVIDYSTDVRDDIPSPSFHLFQNYPNPFNSQTIIEYILEKPEEVRLSIYDVLGREIKVLVNEKQAAGKYKVKFTGNIPAGIYFYRLESGKHIETRKLILIK